MGVGCDDGCDVVGRIEDEILMGRGGKNCADWSFWRSAEESAENGFGLVARKLVS